MLTLTAMTQRCIFTSSSAEVSASRRKTVRGSSSVPSLLSMSSCVSLPCTRDLVSQSLQLHGRQPAGKTCTT